MFSIGFIVLGVVMLFSLTILGTLALGGILAAPWVPLWQNDVRRLLTIAGAKPNELVYDLGAGDGRVIITAAKEYGCRARGFEIALLPYLVCRIRIWLAGVSQHVKLIYANFFTANLGDADIICAFLTPRAMEKLKTKFEKEVKPGCRILSYAFAIPGWEPDIVDKPNEKTTVIYRYTR